MKSSAIKTQNNQAMPAGSRLWSPRELPHLIAWHSLRTLESVNPNITTNRFIDVSGNGNELRNTTSAQFPTCKISSDFGNLKVLDFDGSNDLLKNDPRQIRSISLTVTSFSVPPSLLQQTQVIKLLCHCKESPQMS